MKFFTSLFVAAIGCCVVAGTPAAISARTPDKGFPNIILILADDLGYECIGTNGGTSYKTPVLDKLAATGVRFERCNVQPLCTPTRMQLMTGLYNVRNYVDFGFMDPRSTTFANLFKQAGYSTCITGKWQLGHDPNLPKTFGFDEYCLWQHTRRPERYKNPGLEINGKAMDYTKGEYGPDIVSDYALDYISRKKGERFFLYYPMMLTHDPYDATPDSSDYNDKGNGKKKGKDKENAGINRHFADMVAYMDKLIGKLVARLDETGIRDNTLILFVGDNGTGAGTHSFMGQKLVVGAKGSMTEHGMHVPLIASWPGQIASGKVCSDLVDSTDFLPTICDAAGVSLPSSIPFDGRSFLPQLRGEKGNPRDWYYCWYAPRKAFVGEFAANKHYKLYRGGSFYDLDNDPHEKNSISLNSLTGEAASSAKQLQAALDHYKDARPKNLKTTEDMIEKKGDKKAKKQAKKQAASTET